MSQRRDTLADVRDERRAGQRNRGRAALAVRAPVVVAWLVVGAGAWFGGLVHPALRPETGAARALVTAGLWLAYGVVLVAVLLPGARALTLVRIGVPAGAVELAAAGAVASDEGSGSPLFVVVGLLAAVYALGHVLLPAWAEAQVDAASYGDERRFLLRPPGPVLVALVMPLWAVSVAGAAVGPLLLAHRSWAAGAVTTAVGLPAAAFAAHTLFRLACRWLVFVPNGVVLHDHLAVRQPLPLARRGIASLGPAPAGTLATDLTAQAFGMALEIRLSGPVPASVHTSRSRSEERSLTAVLVSPSRPAAVMSTAERRGLKLARHPQAL